MDGCKTKREEWQRRLASWSRMKCFVFFVLAALFLTVVRAGHEAEKPEVGHGIEREAENAHYGHRVDIAEIYPFVEPEEKRNTKIPSMENLSSQPMPVIPIREQASASLPSIPQRETSKKEDPAEKKQEANYQSRIAFIGGDGINFADSSR